MDLGIRPEKWGRPLWRSMHWVAAGYVGERVEEYKRYFVVLSEVIPCPECRGHYRTKLSSDKEFEKAFESNRSLRLWCMNFHNETNKRLGSKEVWTIEKLLKAYPDRTPPPTTPAPAQLVKSLEKKLKQVKKKHHKPKPKKKRNCGCGKKTLE